MFAMWYMYDLVVWRSEQCSVFATLVLVATHQHRYRRVMHDVVTDTTHQCPPQLALASGTWNK